MALPLSIGWERALIGTILASPDLMNDAGDVLPSDFTGCHQLIWAEMIPLFQRGTLGPRALVEALRVNGTLDNLGFEDLEATGERYIAVLATYRGEELPEYVNQVIGASIKRQLVQTSALIRVEAEDQSIPAEEALDNAERRVMSLRKIAVDRGCKLS